MNIIYKVGPSDTLTSIAKKCGCSVEELAQLNQITTNSLVGVENIVLPTPKENITVIKNLGNDVFLEVTEKNIEYVESLIKNNAEFISYSGDMQNPQVGDKLILSNSKSVYHTIRPLETIQYVANKYGVSVEHIVNLNNLNTTKTFVGQRIKIF